MSIELHCPQCAKLIRAPDDAGGKRGKCPYCKKSVYIPTKPNQGEDIGLAPIDEEEDRRAEQLRREDAEYAADVDRNTGRGVGGGGGATGSEQAVGEVVDLGAEVEAFIIAMRDSKLGEAEAVTSRLKAVGARAGDYVQGLLVDEMVPEFENVPPPLVLGFLKTLVARLAIIAFSAMSFLQYGRGRDGPAFQHDRTLGAGDGG